MTWLVGLFVLSPIKIFTFPLNLEVVDFWIIMGLPIMWLFFILRRQTRISIPFTWITVLILLGSFVSTFVAPNASRSLLVIVKEVYLFVLCITVTGLLCRLNAGDVRRLLVVWAGVVILHGLLIIAQFASPEVWKMTAGIVGKKAGFAVYRPSGLFMSEEAGDANKAAAYQLLGFVPLVLARLPKRTAVVLGITLTCSMLCTGSMGTTIGFTTGLVTAIAAMLVLSPRPAVIMKHITKFAVVALFFGTALSLFLLESDDFRTRIEGILVGRSERSAEGRFDLWGRGKDLFLERNDIFWGVGPGNFRDVDGMDKQLHNDLLAFTVERGLPTALCLVIFAGIAVARALLILRLHKRYPDRAGIEVVAFLAIFVAILAMSLTHQTFHTRELWIVIAWLEAMLFSLSSETSQSGQIAGQPA